MKNNTRTAILFGTLFFLQACGGSPTTFTSTAATGASAAATPPTCTVTTTAENLRIIFMMDNSGSTADTDPNQYYRITTVQNFLEASGSHTNLTYAFGYFSGTAAYFYDTTLAGFTANPVAPFGDASNLTSALATFSQIPANDSTPYNAAISETQQIMAADPNPQSANYVLVFMSDGGPTDLSNNIDADISTLITNLKATAVAKGKLITVSTVYFGPDSDSVSREHISAMASDGDGQFVDTNITTDLVIDNLITVPQCASANVTSSDEATSAGDARPRAPIAN